ncbi:MAG: zf-TFIIB domain-containing protein [Planctomycetaceae bacterium]
MSTSQRSTISCRQCGGNVEAVPGRDYMQCRFCQSLAFPQENPLSVDRITPLSDDVSVACPCCDEPLKKGQIEDRNVAYCGRCYGMLLKNDAFGTVVRERRSRREGLEGETPRPIEPREFERQLRCPNCDRLMEAHPYFGPGNVVIDSCDQCHFLWLDHGELSRIERSAGGREVAPSALHVTSEGEITTVAQPPRCPRMDAEEASPLQLLADLLFGLR